MLLKATNLRLYLVFIISFNIIPVTGQNTDVLTDSLQTDMDLLSINKALYAGSIDVKPGKTLSQIHSHDFEQNLVGQFAGLTVLSRNPEPGVNRNSIFIHGLNSMYESRPLILVDGFPGIGLSSLETDIESVTIIKDGSAVLYGSNTANGVILVKTGRGITGKPVFSIEYNQGFDMPAKLPEMTDSYTYATMLNEIDNYAGGPGRYSPEDLTKYRDGSDPIRYPNTDWSKQVLKKYTTHNSLTASVRGGSSHIRYFVSSGYNKQNGIYKSNLPEYTQKFFRANFDAQNSFLRAGLGFYFNDGTNASTNRSSEEIMSLTTMSIPVMNAFWPGNNPNSQFEYGNNPVVISTNETGTNTTHKSLLDSKFYLSSDLFLKGLTVNACFDYLKNANDNENYLKPWYLYSWDGVSYSDDELFLRQTKVGTDSPVLNKKDSKAGQISGKLFVNYERQVNDKHILQFISGLENSQTNIFLDTRQVRYQDGNNQEIISATSSTSNNRIVRQNAYAFLGYSYSKKYLINLTASYARSPFLPEKNRYFFSPAISLGWQLSEEEFWLINAVSELKISLSWAENGIDEYWGLNDDQESTDQLPNAALSWERASIWNTRIEGIAINNKVSFDLNLFLQKRSDIPLTSILITNNFWKVDKHGFDYTVSYSDSWNKFNYQIAWSGELVKNKVANEDKIGSPDYQKREGHSVNSLLFYQAAGIFKDQEEINSLPHWGGARPGDIIFRDINNDNRIDGLDRIRIENMDIPEFSTALKTYLQYSQFEVSFLFQLQTGSHHYFLPKSGTGGNFFKDAADNRWTPTNTNAPGPRSWNNYNEYWVNQPNTFWLKETSFLRLKYLEAGYNLPSKLVQQIHIKGLRIYVNGVNLFTSDKKLNFDPESDLERGISYPAMKSINCGVECKF